MTKPQTWSRRTFLRQAALAGAAVGLGGAEEKPNTGALFPVKLVRNVRIPMPDGVTLAASTRVKALYETALPIRYYFPRADVRTELLESSETVTECAYKGPARHWSALIEGRVVTDVGWSYDDEVRREGEPVRGLIAFYNERVDLDVGGRRQERPQTGWSRAIAKARAQAPIDSSLSAFIARIRAVDNHTHVNTVVPADS